MIDTHLHVWDRSRSPYGWLDGAPERLRADHSLEQGLEAISTVGFDRAILVQADDTLAETDYLLELAAATPQIVGAVCYLPLERPDVIGRRLPALRENPFFVGVRNLTHDRADPDWILGSDQRRSLDLLEAAGVPLDYIAISPRHRDNLVTVATGHPGLTVVLDHLGNPPLGTRTDPTWPEQFAAAASLPNVIAKVSGMYPGDQGGRSDQVVDVLHTAIAAFGSHRLMLGSDWPMGTVSPGAMSALGALITAVDALEPADAEALREHTAQRVYGLAS